jgi:hypothetical protein
VSHLFRLGDLQAPASLLSSASPVAAAVNTEKFTYYFAYLSGILLFIFVSGTFQ